MRRISGGELSFGHLLIQGVTPVRFVHYDAVEFIDRWSVITGENTFDHGLHGGDLNSGLGLRRHISQLCDGVGRPEGLILLEARIFERIQGLPTQCGSVHQKEDAAKAFCFQETIHQANDGAGLARAGGHGQQAVTLILRQCRLDSFDGFLLIGPHLEVTKPLLLKCLLGVFAAALEQIQKPLRRVKLLQCPGQVARVAGIAKPDA